MRGRSSANSSEGYRPDEHVEHAFEDSTTEIGERSSLPHTREEIIDAPRLHRCHRNDLLREDIERVARIPGGLDLTIVHRPGDGGAGQQVAPELREHDAFADGPGLMSGAADALKTAGHRGRRFDLHHEIDGAHVDPELQRGGRHQRANATSLQQFFHVTAGVAGH